MYIMSVNGLYYTYVLQTYIVLCLCTIMCDVVQHMHAIENINP